MSRSARVTTFFGEDDFEFRLAIGQLEELEEMRLAVLAGLGLPAGEASVQKILERLGSGSALIGEIKAVLRLGLVGAGMEKPEAARLVNRHVTDGELQTCCLAAFAVLSAAWVGSANDQPDGKAEGPAPGEPQGEATVSSSPTARRAGASSTASVRRSASTPASSAP
jgi:hypothetical protein